MTLYISFHISQGNRKSFCLTASSSFRSYSLKNPYTFLLCRSPRSTSRSGVSSTRSNNSHNLLLVSLGHTSLSGSVTICAHLYSFLTRFQCSLYFEYKAPFDKSERRRPCFHNFTAVICPTPGKP